jgi:hypothetical protein
LALSRCAAFPPVDRLCVASHAVEEAGDELGVRPPAAGETEFPEFSGGTVIVVDRLIHGIGVDLAGAIAVDRCRDMGQQLGQLRLVVGAHAFACGAPFGTGAHDRDGTVSQPGRARARCSPALTEAGVDHSVAP